MIAINEYIQIVEGVTSKSRSECRSVLGEIGGEDLRAIYSNIVKTLHGEALYEGIYQLDGLEYALSKTKKIIEDPEGGHGDEKQLTVDYS